MYALPSYTSSTLPRSKDVVIDFASLSRDEAKSDHFSATSLLAWVQSSPSTSSIHVYLPSHRQEPVSRRLERMLLTLGCTVTRRTQFFSPA